MAVKYYLRMYTAAPRHLLSVAKYKITKPSLPKNRFIIFGEGRCGSTALVSRLGSLEGVHCDNEVLAYKVPFPYAHVLDRCSRSTQDIYGCKILAFHIRDKQPLKDRDGFVRKLYEDGFKIIHLRRENLIHHAMSNIRANQFGYHQQVAKKRKKTGKVVVNIDELMGWMKRTESLYAYEDVLLKEVPHLTLTYENNIASEEKQQKTMVDVCQFLGIPYAAGECAYMKISPKSLADSIENYEEIATALQGTPYAAFLDKPERVESAV